METFFVFLAICAGNSPVTGEFPAQWPVTRSVDVFFDLRPNKPLSKQWWGWWFETPSRPLWRHCNIIHGQWYGKHFCIVMSSFFQKMIIDGIPTGQTGCNYFFLCSRELRWKIRHSEESYCREHDKYCYYICLGCKKYICRDCMRQTVHSGVVGIKPVLLWYSEAKVRWVLKDKKCVRDVVSLKQKMSSSFVSTKRTIQSVTNRLTNAIHRENRRLLLELDQIRQHCLDNNPTSDELIMPDMKVLSAHSNIKEEDMREGLHPEVVKAVLTLTIAENTVDANRVHFKPNTGLLTRKMGSLVALQWRHIRQGVENHM